LNILGRPLISLLHPTARVAPSEAFPRGWKDAHDAWLARADHPERIEYVLTVHESRWKQWTDEEGRSSHGAVVPDVCWKEFQAVRNDKRDCVVDQTNLAAECSRGMIIMGVQDDYYPPEHWDTLILEAFCGCPAEEITESDEWLTIPILLHCSSGGPVESERALMIGGAATRPVLEHYGYSLDPDFESMFADNWQAFQVKRDAAAGILQIIERLDIVFDHRHPIYGKGQMDDIYRLQNRDIAYRQGAAIFHKKVTGAKVVVLCLPGESFRNEWVGTMFQTIQSLGNMGYITAPHWCYTSNVYCTRIELAQGALEFRPKADYILWVDDDNLVTADQVQILIDDLESHPELGGVTGWCWCDHNETDGVIASTWRMSVGRQSWPDLKCLRLTAEDLQNAFEVSPLITSDDMAPHAFWSGFPCVLLRRETLERMGPSAFAPMSLPVNYGFTGEDTSFFINAHRMGVKFAVDIRIKVPHVKWRAIEPVFVPGARPEKSLPQSVAVG
jgi:hypothetical protein